MLLTSVLNHIQLFIPLLLLISQSVPLKSLFVIANVLLVLDLPLTVDLVKLTEKTLHLVLVLPVTMNQLQDVNAKLVLTNVVPVLDLLITVPVVLLTELLCQLVLVQSDIMMKVLLLVLLVKTDVVNVLLLTSVKLVVLVTIYITHFVQLPVQMDIGLVNPTENVIPVTPVV
jgi:hypothetical protein